MHIPDGFLSPQTCIAAYAVSMPFWVTASRKLNKTLRQSRVPLLALAAAFSFILMMFNIPIAGGTTGHAVGSVLVAVLLGPWAACISLTVVIVMQALLFHDGGITCIGANCFNMAIVMPFTGYLVYKLIAGRSEAQSVRRWLGAAIGGYAGINIAAFTTAVMFGLQPLIAHNNSGQALYAPYNMHIAIPAMMIGHLTVFGFVEAMVTGMAVAFLQRVDSGLLYKVQIKPEGVKA